LGHDPYKPGYTPDGESSRDGLGDVGHGNQFGIDLYSLYRAGRVNFPEHAQRFSSLTYSMQSSGYQITKVADSVGNPAGLTKLAEIRETLHAAFYRTATILNEVGPALVTLADDYAATDDTARGSFSRLIRSPDEKGKYADPPPYVSPPVNPDEPYTPPGGPSNY